MGPIRPCGTEPQVGPPPAARGGTAARLNGAEVYQDRRRRVERSPRRAAEGVSALAERRDYGFGRRPMAVRTVRAPTESPISASSAVAFTTVERSSVPDAGIGLRDRGAGGVPEGCPGCRNGLERGLRRGAWRGALGPSGASVLTGLSALLPRLSLRRWGRVCGREPRISDGGSSGIDRI